MFKAEIRPGDGFVRLKVFERTNCLTETGRPTKQAYRASGEELYGMIMNSSQQEVEQWKQNGHPVTHKILQSNGRLKIKPESLIRHEAEDRNFIVQGIKNPANLSVTTVYFVEERLDIKELIE